MVKYNSPDNGYRYLEMSDEVLFGHPVTLEELNPRTEAEAAGDPTVDWDLLERTRDADDAQFDDEDGGPPAR